MNVKTIKNRIFKSADFSLAEWNIEKSPSYFFIDLTSYGISDNRRQQMTGDQVNAKRQSDNDKLKKMAILFARYNPYVDMTWVRIDRS